MLKSFCWFCLGKNYDINIAYLGAKLIEKLNEIMSFGSSAHSMVFQLRLLEEKFTSSSASIESILQVYCKSCNKPASPLPSL